MSLHHSTAFPACFPVEYRGMDGIGFPGYCVGSDGSVWSRHRKGIKDEGDCGLEVCWHRLRICKAGRYRTIMLIREDGERITVSVHSLVLRAFIGERPKGQQARHLNGNRKDNRLLNLIWGTPKENGQDKVEHGRSLRGQKNVRSILTENQVREIRALISRKVPQVRIAKMFGVSQPTISAIKMRTVWKYLE